MTPNVVRCDHISTDIKARLVIEDFDRSGSQARGVNTVQFFPDGLLFLSVVRMLAEGLVGGGCGKAKVDL